MKLAVVRLGHPALRLRSRRVSPTQIASLKFQTFLDDLADTCVQNAGVGIAAPQVGINQRVIIVHVDAHNPRYTHKAPFPLTFVINPKIQSRSAYTEEDWEGDLSVGVRGLVPRAVSCVVSGLDRTGQPVLLELNDPFHARVFQHEIDHLNGWFFTDRIKNRKSLYETAMWEEYIKPHL